MKMLLEDNFLKILAPYWLRGSNTPWFMCLFRSYINCLFVCLLNFFLSFLPSLLSFFWCFLSILFTSLLVYFLTYLSTSSRIEPFHFQAAGRRTQPKLASVFLLILCCSIFCYSCMFAFVVSVSVFSKSQDIGWEERLQNDLFCVGWDVKL